MATAKGCEVRPSTICVRTRCDIHKTGRLSVAIANLKKNLHFCTTTFSRLHSHFGSFVRAIFTFDAPQTHYGTIHKITWHEQQEHGNLRHGLWFLLWCWEWKMHWFRGVESGRWKAEFIPPKNKKHNETQKMSTRTISISLHLSSFPLRRA